MTDPAPSVQPVRAWAVVDRDGEICHIMFHRLPPEMWDLNYEGDAPHRVIRVEIREVNDEHL